MSQDQPTPGLQGCQTDRRQVAEMLHRLNLRQKSWDCRLCREHRLGFSRPDLRLLDHLNDGVIDLSSVEVLVLDEADTMCDMGFLPDVRRILRHLPANRQNMFFSATMPPEIRALSGSILNNPAVVEVDRIAPAKTVSHALYSVVPLNLGNEGEYSRSRLLYDIFIERLRVIVI